MSSEVYTAVKQDAVDVDVEEASIVKTWCTSEILEGRELTWTDTYFEETETEGVIAVFDLDYDLARKRIRYVQAFLFFFRLFFGPLSRLSVWWPY